MGKSVRTVLLSVSATLAIAVFIVLWTVRPGSESAVLDEARARQDQSLLEVSRPLETDLQAISNAEAFSEDVMEIILSDEDFLVRLAEALVSNQSLRDAIAAELGSEVDTLVDDAMAGFIEDNRAEVNRIIAEEIDSYVAANYDAAIEIVNSEIEGRMAEFGDTYTSLIDTRIQDYLDANTEALIALINSEIEAYADENSDELIELIRSEIAFAISTGFIEGNRAELDRIVAEGIDSYVAANYDAGIKIVNSEIEGRMAEFADTFTSLVDAEVQAYLDANAEALVALINSEIEAYVDENIDELVELVRSEIAASIIDENALIEILVEPLTQAVYDEIISFVEGIDIEAIMGEVEKQIAQAFDDNLSAANAYTDEVVEEAIAQAFSSVLGEANAYTDEAIDNVLSLASSYAEELSQKIADAVAAKVVEEIEEQGYTAPAEPVEVPAASSAMPVVSIPNLESLPQADSSNYNEVRSNVRQAVLDELLAYLN